LNNLQLTVDFLRNRLRCAVYANEPHRVGQKSKPDAFVYIFAKY